MLQDLTPSSFSDQLGSTFRIQLGDGQSLDTELYEVLLHEPHGGPRKQPFSIHLRGPRGAALQQAIYRLEHETMGPLEIFLVTIGPDEKGMRYEAVFN
ncbi:MAG: hypothetical protein ABUT39_27940 [Acidobacteriota bacterium]